MADSFHELETVCFFGIKKRLKKNFFTRYLCVIDIYIYICSLKRSLY